MAFQLATFIGAIIRADLLFDGEEEIVKIHACGHETGDSRFRFCPTCGAKLIEVQRRPLPLANLEEAISFDDEGACSLNGLEAHQLMASPDHYIVGVRVPPNRLVDQPGSPVWIMPAEMRRGKADAVAALVKAGFTSAATQVRAWVIPHG